MNILRQIGKEYKLQRNLIIHERTKTSVRLRRPNKDIFYIVGFLADGCLSERKWKYEVEIYQRNRKLLREIARLFEKNFLLKPKISWHNGAYRLRVCSKPLFFYLRDLLKSCSDLEKIRFNKYFIAGFIDAEGSLIKTKKGVRFVITQADKDILMKIARILKKRFKIHSRIYGPYKHRNSRKEMFYIHIEGKYVMMFFRNVPSLRWPFCPPDYDPLNRVWQKVRQPTRRDR